jgi:hypothetical protein
MSPTREAGWYWVRPKGKGTNWLIARWEISRVKNSPRFFEFNPTIYGCWVITGESTEYNDTDLDEIGPRIEPPMSAPKQSGAPPHMDWCPTGEHDVHGVMYVLHVDGIACARVWKNGHFGDRYDWKMLGDPQGRRGYMNGAPASDTLAHAKATCERIVSEELAKKKQSEESEPECKPSPEYELKEKTAGIFQLSRNGRLAGMAYFTERNGVYGWTLVEFRSPIACRELSPTLEAAKAELIRMVEAAEKQPR